MNFVKMSSFRMLSMAVLLFLSVSLFAQDTQNSDDYNTLLNRAEKLFFEKKYSDAKGVFEQALKMKPDERHPGNRIREINSLLGLDEQEDNDYARLIREADQLYEQQAWEEALKVYKEASLANPEQTYTTDRILELHDRIRTEKNQNAAYQNAIEQGILYLEQKRYDQAIAEFEIAREIKPGEDLPLEKIGEINKLLNTEKEYNEAVEQADQHYMNRDYDQAELA